MNFDEAMDILRDRYKADPVARQALTVVGTHATKTVEAARLKFIEDTETQFEKGNKIVKCVVCQERHTIYYRTICEKMVGALGELCRIYYLTRDWVHYSKAVKVVEPFHDYAKLQWWGFMVPKPRDLDDSKPSNGYWRPTPKAYDFLNGRIRVPSHVWERDSEPKAWSNDTINRDEVKYKKFVFDDLWKPIDVENSRQVIFR